MSRLPAHLASRPRSPAAWRPVLRLRAAGVAFLLMTACSVYDDSLLEGEGGTAAGGVATGGSGADGGTTTGGSGDGGAMTGGGDTGGTPAGGAGGNTGGSPVGGSGGAMGGDGGATGGMAGGGNMGGGGGGGSTCMLPTMCLGETENDVWEMIDDRESGGNNLPSRNGRNGPWFNFDAATSETLELNDTTDPGCGVLSIYFKATGVDADGTGIGANFTGTKSEYDLSGYAGLTFRAKKGPDNEPLFFRVAIPITDTDDGGACAGGAGCFDHYGRNIPITEEWATYNVAFTDMTQEGFGEVVPFDRDQAIGIQFRMVQGSSATDETHEFFIDDIALLKCSD